jgi:hypothetical protein
LDFSTIGPYNYTKRPCNIWGLSYYPHLLNYSPDKDAPLYPFKNGHRYSVPQEFSAYNRALLKKEILLVGDSLSTIVEIGVARNRKEWASTNVILENKPEECLYLGIDLRDVSFLESQFSNTHTIQCDSRDKSAVYSKMSSIGLSTIDFLLIDGYHSLNVVLNDWGYAEKLSLNGIVFFHDISAHPGPQVVFEAINENLFEKNKYGADTHEDWGVGIARRKNG